MKTITEVLEQRAKLVVDARAILDKAEKEKRELDAEERKQFDTMIADADKLKDEADQMQKDLESRNHLEAAEKEMAASRGRQSSQDSGKQQEPEVRTLVEVELFDVSVVTYPAYPDTSVAVRSLEHAKEAAKPKTLDILRRRIELSEKEILPVGGAK